MEENFKNLYRKQRKEIKASGNYGRLYHLDILRLDRLINNKIFESDECVIMVEQNFSYKAKKIRIIRLLYHNYIDKIEKNDILINTCNEGEYICSNINHIKKI